MEDENRTEVIDSFSLNFLLTDKKLNIYVTLFMGFGLFVFLDNQLSIWKTIFITVTTTLFFLMIVNLIHTVIKNQIQLSKRIGYLDRR
jgi:hypothetical protein